MPGCQARPLVVTLCVRSDPNVGVAGLYPLNHCPALRATVPVSALPPVMTAVVAAGAGLGVGAAVLVVGREREGATLVAWALLASK